MVRAARPGALGRARDRPREAREGEARRGRSGLRRLALSQIAVVVPCFDEAARLSLDAFRDFAARHPRVRFLMVDDGSSDATPELLRRLRDEDPKSFGLLELARNHGKAEAVRRGMRLALEGQPLYAGYWDADLSTPLDHVPRFAALLDARPELVMVLGSRVRLLGRSIERNEVRHYAGRVYATLASWTLGLAVYDTQCGAKLLRNTPEVAALFEEPFCTNWCFDVELLARLCDPRRGDALDPASALYEYPLREWREVPGSKVGPRDFFRALVELARIRSRYFGSRDPGSSGTRKATRWWSW